MELSIIIPTREEQDAIVATLTQFKDLQLSHEVIVADGGSVDETVIRATPYADKGTKRGNRHVLQKRYTHHTSGDEYTDSKSKAHG